MAKNETNADLHDEVTALRMQVAERQAHALSGATPDHEAVMNDRLRAERDRLKAQLAQMDKVDNTPSFPPALEEHAAYIARETAKLARKGEVENPLETTVLPVDPSVAEVPQSSKGK